jgi:hypothetical protein
MHYERLRLTGNFGPSASKVRKGQPWLGENGYLRTGRDKYVHRMVWEKHHGPIPNGHHIHHKDGDKLNNVIENLELLTASEHGCLHHKRKWVV